MDAVAIDIHSGKLLDWLISRNHCQKEWIKKVPEVHEKIKHAIIDMPENKRILDLLKAGNMNFFHCQEILKILHETEKDTKNIFGFYSSQRIKDWRVGLFSKTILLFKEIVELYKKDNLFLAESAQMLQRLVHYEIPLLKKIIRKKEKLMAECERKEQEYAKIKTDVQKNYKKELSRLQIKGEDARSEFISLAANLPIVFKELAVEASSFKAVIDYYKDFRIFIGWTFKESEEFIPLLEKLASKGEDMTVSEWRCSKDLDEKRPQTDDGIITLEDDNIVICDDEHFSIFEYGLSFNHLIRDVSELVEFLHFRIFDEENISSSYVYIAGLEELPQELAAVSVEQMKEWHSSLTKFLLRLRDPTTRHLTRIRTSPSYVDHMVNCLEKKHCLEDKYKELEAQALKTLEVAAGLIAQSSKDHETLCDVTRLLQQQMEDEISKLYQGREVNIIGEIQAVLD